MTTKAQPQEQEEPSKDIYDDLQGIPLDGVERFFQLGTPLFNEVDYPNTTHPLIKTCGQILEFYEDPHTGAFLDEQLGVVFQKIGFHANDGGDHFVYGTYTTEEDGDVYTNFFIAAYNRTPNRDDPDKDDVTAYGWISGEIHTADNAQGNEQDYFVPNMLFIPYVDPKVPYDDEPTHTHLDPQKLEDICHCLSFLESALKTFATGHVFDAFAAERDSLAHKDPEKVIHDYFKESEERTYLNLAQDIRALKNNLDKQAGISVSDSEPVEIETPQEGEAAPHTTAHEVFANVAGAKGYEDMESAIPQEILFGIYQLDRHPFFHVTENADINAPIFGIIQNMLRMAECSAAEDFNTDSPISNISLHYRDNEMKTMHAFAAFVDYDYCGPHGVERRGLLVVGQEETFLSNGERFSQYQPYCIVSGHFFQPEGSTKVLFQAPIVQVRINQAPHNPGALGDGIVFLDGPDHMMNGLCYADEAIQFILRKCRLDTLIHNKWAFAPDEQIGQAFASACERTVDEYVHQVNWTAENVYAVELAKGTDHRFYYPYPTARM